MNNIFRDLPTPPFAPEGLTSSSPPDKTQIFGPPSPVLLNVYHYKWKVCKNINIDQELEPRYTEVIVVLAGPLPIKSWLRADLLVVSSVDPALPSNVDAIVHITGRQLYVFM